MYGTCTSTNVFHTLLFWFLLYSVDFFKAILKKKTYNNYKTVTNLFKYMIVYLFIKPHPHVPIVILIRMYIANHSEQSLQYVTGTRRGSGRVFLLLSIKDEG